MNYHSKEAYKQLRTNLLFCGKDIKVICFTSSIPDHSVLGLSHFLSGLSSLDEVLYESNIRNLDIIFTGPMPPNPSELLGSYTFVELLQKLREKYDFIIIDTPPLGSVIDSVIVADQCDGVILIIEANVISYRFAQRIKAQLEMSKCKILGAVLNKVDEQKKHYPYYMKRYEKIAYKYYEEL